MFKSQEYNSIKVILIAVVIIGVGYFIFKNVSNRGVGQKGTVYDMPQAQNSNGAYRKCASNMAPWIQVISPNGGEVFPPAQNAKIKWSSCNLSSADHVDIRIAQVNPTTGQLTGGLWYNLATQTANDGSEIIMIHENIPLGTYKLVVRDMSVWLDGIGHPGDISDNSFKVLPAGSTGTGTGGSNSGGGAGGTVMPK